jgi:hypothetical protein
MRALSAAKLFGVWERGLAESPAQRALILLESACDEAPVEQVRQLSVGQRDACLLELRELTFGRRLASITVCPACTEQLEFQVDAMNLRAASPAEQGKSLQLTHSDYRLEFRLPTSLDLASLDPAAGRDTNRQELLRRCLIRARRAEEEVTAAELPSEVEAAMARRMAEADSQADVQLALACPRCEHTWHTPFDIASYFWTEIHAWAGRLFHEIHSLASAYGWREADILALSPWRRQAYLELIER